MDSDIRGEHFTLTNNNFQDLKQGGTPLHWVTDKPLLELLLGLGCDINAKNFKGSTALHVIVKDNQFDNDQY